MWGRKRERVYIRQMETREVLRAREDGISCRCIVSCVYDGPTRVVEGSVVAPSTPLGRLLLSLVRIKPGY